MVVGAWGKTAGGSVIMTRGEDGTWSKEDVPGASIRELRYDNAGHMHMLAQSKDRHEWLYAKKTDGAPKWETVFKITAKAFVRTASLVVGKDGPIVYVAAGQADLLEARRGADGTWTTQSALLGGCQDLQARVAPDGTHHIACVRSSTVGGGWVQTPYVFHAARKGTAPWNQTWLGMGSWAQLRFFKSGHPHITYIAPKSPHGTNGTHARHAWFDGKDWHMRLGGAGGGQIKSVNLQADVAITDDGKVHVASAGVWTTNDLADATPPDQFEYSVHAEAVPKLKRVVSVPAGIDCPGTCKASFDRYTVIRLKVDAGDKYDVRGPGCRPTPGGTTSQADCLVMLGVKGLFFYPTIEPKQANWAALVGSPKPDKLTDIALAPDDGSIVVGSTDGVVQSGFVKLGEAEVGRLFVARHDAQGKPLWLVAGKAQLGANAVARVAPLPDGSFVVGATTLKALDFAGQKLAKPGASLVALDANGTAKWSKQVFAEGGGSISSVVPLGTGVAAAGTLTGGDLGKGKWASRGSVDGWIAGYDAGGKLTWAAHLGDKNKDAGLRLAAHKGGVIGAVQVATAYKIGEVEVDMSKGSSGRLLLAFDAAGKLLWHAFDHEATATVGSIVSWGDNIGVASTNNHIFKYDGSGTQLWNVSLFQQMRYGGGIAADGAELIAVGTSQPNMKTPAFPKRITISSEGKPAAAKALGGGLGYAHGALVRKAGDLLIGLRSSAGGTFGALKFAAMGHEDVVVAAVPK